MASRALQNKAKAQVMQYKTKAGAYKIVESTSSESLYGQITVFNDSA